MKKIIVLLFIVIMSTNVYCQEEKRFNDLNNDHWAYKAIMEMTNKKVLNGYEDKSFKPNNSISRVEFATVLVKTMNLSIIDPEKASFNDVEKSNWGYKFVETAKYYLTGWHSDVGDVFLPKTEAVREDMAVAMVKAMGLENDSYESNILDAYVDKDEISPKLAKYVAIAIKNKIMIGSPYGEDGTKKQFNPQKNITRAETSVLLLNVINKGYGIGEKTTYDKPNEVDTTKSYVDSETNDSKAIVTGKIENDKIYLKWSKVDGNDFVYYKVVISKNNENPKYPEDGYLTYISDVNKTEWFVKPGDGYNGGDLGGKVLPDTEYYFSVTAVYDNAKIPGNSIKLKTPKTNDSEVNDSNKVANVEGKIENGRVYLKWSKVNADNFNYYKVVLSKNNDKPKYPDDGYLTYISDVNTTSYDFKAGDSYNGGDFDGIVKAGEEYFISITSVYNDEKNPGNVIKLKIPGESTSEQTTSELAPKVVAVVDGKSIKVSWDKIDNSKLQGYKVVISKNDSTPAYPENGYLFWITDKNKISVNVDNTTGYNNGDFGSKLTSGQEYYFSVTAVYSDKKVAGNVIKLVYP